MNATAAVAVETSAPAAPLIIDPNRVTLDKSGFGRQSWFVRAPMGMVPEDLRSPSIWSAAQGSKSRALRKFDDVMVVAHDESWAVTAVVGFADAQRAVLTGLKVLSMPIDRFDRLFEDQGARVEFIGTGFVGVSKRNGSRLTRVFHTAELAERALRARRPAPNE